MYRGSVREAMRRAGETHTAHQWTHEFVLTTIWQLFFHSLARVYQRSQISRRLRTSANLAQKRVLIFDFEENQHTQDFIMSL